MGLRHIGKSGYKGFTIIEMVLVVAVLAVLVVLAIPAFNGLVQGKQLVGQATEVTSALTYARSEAIARATNVVICASDDGAACSGDNDWSTGWIIFVDKNENGSIDTLATDLLKKEGAMLGAVSLNADAASITFNYQGESEAAGTVSFDLCAENANEAGLDKNKSRKILVNTVGATSISMGTATCP